MTLITDIRRNVTESTPLLAVVGATDYAVERVRAVAKDAAVLQGELEKRVQGLERVPALVEERVKAFDPRAVRAVPALALARALETAGQMEQSYEKFAVRGREVIERVGRQSATQDLLEQGRATIGRTRAAVTTARKAVDETASAALSAVSLGRKETVAAVADVAGSVAATEKVVGERAAATRAAAGRTVTTARRGASGARTAAKGVVTSTRRTAAKSVDAVEAVAGTAGEPGETPAE